jgi:ABC-2 type transport system ATP-binding protein
MESIIEKSTHQLKGEFNHQRTKSDQNQTEILKVDHLTKIYGKNFLVSKFRSNKKVMGANNVSFSVKKGEIFGFLGPNGAGKTTTIRSILNFLKIQTGTISIFGMNHREDSLKIREHLSYIPGDVSLFENFTGIELLEYLNNFRPFDIVFLNELKEIFRVNLDKKIKSLSKGNKQQVALIVALASKPQLLILDEPSSGLDPLMMAKLHNILLKLKKEGVTIFLSSHNLSEVQAICDRVGIIKEGKMILVEDVNNLKQKFLQNVKISFMSGNIPSVEEISKIDSVLEAYKINENTFSLKIREKINPFLKFISKYNVEKISIEEASLEEIFLQYYM